MTGEEAIAIFKGFKFLPREMKAVEMAIQALEQEPRKDEVILTKEEYGKIVSSEFDNGYAKGYREALEQEPTTKNDIAQERYQDLIEYFGDEKVAKTILESRKEFKAWLERLRWNVKRADELARELEQIKSITKNDLGVDCIDRTQLLKAMDTWDKFGYTTRYGLERLDKADKGFVPYVKYEDMVNCVKGMPQVTPQPKTGHWIPTHGNVKCSVCGSVKDSREVGKSTHYCSFCGAKMESEDKQWE